MRAVVFGQFGPSSVLEVREIDEPHPGDGQVRIRVGASSVNPIDGKVRAGFLAPESTATINDPLQAAGQSAAGVAAIASLLGDERAETLEQARRLDPLRAALIDTLPGTGASGRTEWLAELWEHRAPLSQALRSMLGQLAAAASGTVTSWSDQTDEVMIAQGEPSARVGQFISARVVPSCDDLAERLSGGGAILDVGTGIGALATALAEAFPAASVIGIDIADRPLQIARQRLNQREPALQQRVRYAEQDIIALRDINVYDLIWLPAPFLPSDKLNEALAVSASALREGGWIIVGTNPEPADAAAAALDAWLAFLGAGSTESASSAGLRLSEIVSRHIAFLQSQADQS